MKKIGLSLLCFVLMLVVIIACYFASIYLSHKNEVEAVLAVNQIDEKSDGVDGLPEGTTLSTNITSVTDEYLYFSDRVLQCFRYDANEVQVNTDIFINAMDAIPEGVNKYLMLLPLRIAFEDSAYQVYSDDVLAAISEIYSDMPPDVITLDCANVLASHKDEYLYFRTDIKWTALGAYYGAQVFCEKAGIDNINIKNFREYRLENYIGALQSLPNASTFTEYSDYVSFYMLDDAVNKQTISVRKSKDEYFTYESPLLALSRRGTDIFIGGYYSHSIIQGDINNGKTLMLLGDDNAKIFAPWLTKNYENIIVVNQLFFNNEIKLEQFFSDYNINDFLILESAANITDSIYSNRITEIFNSFK